jgi:hypothetical protein
LFDNQESATTAMIQFVTISPMVDHLRKGILLPNLSDQAPKRGEMTKTKAVAIEKLAQYRISGTLLSNMSH